MRLGGAMAGSAIFSLSGLTSLTSGSAGLLQKGSSLRLCSASSLLLWLLIKILTGKFRTPHQ